MILGSIWWVISRLFAFLAVCGVLAGIIDDVPGVGDTVAGNSLKNVLSGGLTKCLEILVEYPIGVVAGLSIAAFFR